MSWDQIINTGSTSWQLVDVNKPSADISTSVCNALPGVDDWENLSDPLGTNVARSALGRLDSGGRPLIDVKWELEFEYGSRYRGGGAFIRTCWITVPTCTVSTGYDVQMGVRVEDPRNGGSSTAPVGLLRIHIDATVNWKGGQDSRHWLVAIRGDGAMQI